MGIEIIDILKKQLNLTSKDLSEKSGVPLGTLNKILNGTTKDPKLETLKSLSKVLGCSLDDFDDDNKADKLKILTNSFNKLNDTGKDEAVKRIEELTYIDKYKYTNTTKVISLPNIEQPIWENEGKEHLMPIASHDKPGNFTEEEYKHDNDLMDNDDLWK